jgi:hypothetical protein
MLVAGFPVQNYAPPRRTVPELGSADNPGGIGNDALISSYKFGGWYDTPTPGDVVDNSANLWIIAR